MWRDEIVEEIRKERDSYAAKFNYDVKAMVQDLQNREMKSIRKLVSFSPKAPVKIMYSKAK